MTQDQKQTVIAPIDPTQAGPAPVRSAIPNPSLRPTPLAAAAVAAATIDNPPPVLDAPPEFDAAALLSRMRTVKQTVADEKSSDDDKKYLYFYACRRGHIALWFRQNPKDEIVQPKAWFTTYKKPDEPWMGYVWCQECYDADEEGYPRGEEHGIQCHYVPQGRRSTAFITYPRWLYKIARDPETALREGAIRVADNVYQKQQPKKEVANAR